VRIFYVSRPWDGTGYLVWAFSSLFIHRLVAARPGLVPGAVYHTFCRILRNTRIRDMREASCHSFKYVSFPVRLLFLVFFVVCESTCGLCPLPSPKCCGLSHLQATSGGDGDTGGGSDSGKKGTKRKISDFFIKSKKAASCETEAQAPSAVVVEATTVADTESDRTPTINTNSSGGGGGINYGPYEYEVASGWSGEGMQGVIYA